MHCLPHMLRSHSLAPSELLHSKKFQTTLILAFEANSALSRKNETKIVKIIHSAPYKCSTLFHRFPLTFDTMLASGDITGIRKMSRLQSQTYYAPSISGGGGGGPSGGTNKFDRSRNLTLKSKSSRGTVEPLGRSSLRSKSSSNSSGDRVKLFKNCVKKIFLFLFTQVGVGAFVVMYTIAGALIFQVSYQAQLTSTASP